MENKNSLVIYCLFIGIAMGIFISTIFYTSFTGIGDKFLNDKEYKIDTLRIYNGNHLVKTEYKFVLK